MALPGVVLALSAGMSDHNLCRTRQPNTLAMIMAMVPNANDPEISDRGTVATRKIQWVLNHVCNRFASTLGSEGNR